MTNRNNLKDIKMPTLGLTLDKEEIKKRKILGNRIKAIRIDKGISQLELANRINKSQAYVANIEAGRKRISYELLEKIAEALGVPVSEIIGEPEKQRERTIEDIAWEMVNLYLEKTGQKVSDKTRRKMYEFTLYKLKQAEGDMKEVIKLLAS